MGEASRAILTPASLSTFGVAIRATATVGVGGGQKKDMPQPGKEEAQAAESEALAGLSRPSRPLDLAPAAPVARRPAAGVAPAGRGLGLLVRDLLLVQVRILGPSLD